MTRWKVTIEYKGLDYAGWQYQDNAPSIQKAVEEAIFKFCQQSIRIHAAGRTDSGVHARGQVAHFDLDYGDRPLSGFELAKAINFHLRPQPIAIVAAEPVPEEFHARFSATNKLYIYKICNRSAPLGLDQGLMWHVHKPLDADAMQAAAQILCGQHDFTTFRDTECQAKSPVRTLRRLDVTRTGDIVEIHAEAQSFLHHQVRNMVGALMLIGTHKWTQEDLCTALAARDRTKGGMTVPPDGLYLMKIDY